MDANRRFTDGCRRVALLGSACDPIHNGHIQLATSALALVDEVWILPVYKHMFSKDMASFEDRVSLCNLATSDFENIHVCRFEHDVKWQGGTVDLIQAMQANYSCDFYFIIGQDNAEHISKWAKHEEITADDPVCPFIVSAREGHGDFDESMWFFRKPHLILEHTEKLPDVSSTAVKLKIKSGDTSVANDLNRYVLKFIQNKDLYS